MPIGLLAIISRYYGEKNLDKASEVSQKIIQLLAFAGIFFIILGPEYICIQNSAVPHWNRDIYFQFY